MQRGDFNVSARLCFQKKMRELSNNEAQTGVGGAWLVARRRMPCGAIDDVSWRIGPPPCRSSLTPWMSTQTIPALQ